MNLDWARLKAVVLESDDWGLCAWAPDREAWQALAETPAFRSRAGRRYGGSTLESASDVKGLADLRDTVARWASQTKRQFTLDELESVVQYLNESHYRFGLPPDLPRPGG